MRIQAMASLRKLLKTLIVQNTGNDNSIHIAFCESFGIILYNMNNNLRRIP